MERKFSLRVFPDSSLERKSALFGSLFDLVYYNINIIAALFSDFQYFAASSDSLNYVPFFAVATQKYIEILFPKNFIYILTSESANFALSF